MQRGLVGSKVKQFVTTEHHGGRGEWRGRYCCKTSQVLSVDNLLHRAVGDRWLAGSIGTLQRILSDASDLLVAEKSRQSGELLLAFSTLEYILLL